MGIVSIIIVVLAVIVLGLTRIAVPGMTRGVLTGAVVIGGIGFVGGFFGPMLLTPEASQGPLLGLFITGPLGVVVGAVGGAIYAYRRNRQVRESMMF